MWRRQSKGPRRWRLSILLLVPVAVLVPLAMLGLVVLEELAARDQAEGLVSQRATTVLHGVTDRLAERERSKRVYVELLATQAGLAEAVARGDAIGGAQVLAPLQARLGLRHLVVATEPNAALLTLGATMRGAPIGPLVTDGLVGITRATTVVGDDGLIVLAAGPIKGPGGIVGVLIVGNTLGGAELTQIRERDGVELALLRAGRVVTATPAAPAVDHFLANGGLIPADIGVNDTPWEERHFRTAFQPLADNGLIAAFIPTTDLDQASRRRLAVLATGGGVLLAVLLVLGLALTRGLARPLVAMVASTRDMARGQYARRVPPSRVDEVNVLATTVNSLAEQLEAQLARLNHQAFYDLLTGLPNRALFRDRLERALARANRRHDTIGVMFIDLDNFKVINDSLGHQKGDELLIAVASQLQACARAEDTVARFGGDEFVILLDNIGGRREAELVAKRVADQLAHPLNLNGQEVIVSASIGVVIGSTSHEGAEHLLRDADVAMYRAKAAGKGRHAIFDPSMSTDARERLDIERGLRRALAEGELRVCYQPIVLLETGRVCEVEALVRWEHPEQGLIAPGRFIPVAEETGLIVAIGEWVLREACQHARAWQMRYPCQPPLMVSVNLSLRQLQQPTLVDDIKRVIAATGIDPRSVKFEITESAMMRDTEQTIAALWRLKELGVQLAVDDFGTGYSSLAYLKCLPIDILKIDRSFVAGIDQQDHEAMAIVSAIVGLAKSLNLQVVGEGIETSAQLDHLRTLACDRGQGFFFSRPVSATIIDELLGAALPATAVAEVA